jgi:hypothetical protein
MASTLLQGSPLALGMLADALRELSMISAAACPTETFDACRWLVGKIGPCSAYRLTLCNLLDIFHIVKGFPALQAAIGSYPDEEARVLAAVEAATGEREGCRARAGAKGARWNTLDKSRPNGSLRCCAGTRDRGMTGAGAADARGIDAEERRQRAS